MSRDPCRFCSARTSERLEREGAGTRDADLENATALQSAPCCPRSFLQPVSEPRLIPSPASSPRPPCPSAQPRSSSACSTGSAVRGFAMSSSIFTISPTPSRARSATARIWDSGCGIPGSSRCWARRAGRGGLCRCSTPIPSSSSTATRFATSHSGRCWRPITRRTRTSPLRSCRIRRLDHYNGIVLDEQDRVTGWVPKGRARASRHFIGVQVARASIFAGLEDGVPAESVSGVYQQLLAQPGRLRGFRPTTSFLDVGTPRGLSRGGAVSGRWQVQDPMAHGPSFTDDCLARRDGWRRRGPRRLHRRGRRSVPPAFEHAARSWCRNPSSRTGDAAEIRDGIGIFPFRT